MTDAHEAGSREPAPNALALRHEYSFQLFAEGPTNAFALRTAKAIASGTQGIMPVLLHGPESVGKTHLLQAMAQEHQARFSEAVRVYVNAQDLTTSAPRTRALAQIHSDPDLLFVDNIERVCDGDEYEDIRHALVVRIANGRKTVMAGDLKGEEVLQSRVVADFRSGFNCHMEHADFDLRMAIMRAHLPRILVECQVSVVMRERQLEQFAFYFHSPRLMLGALASFVGSRREDLANISAEELREQLKLSYRLKLTVASIQKTVSVYYDLKEGVLVSSSRAQKLARIRQIAMWLCRQYTDCSYPNIGQRFGGRDHTTVMHGFQRIDTLRGTDAKIARDIEAISRKLVYS